MPGLVPGVLIERVDCDLDFAEPAARWIGGALRVLTPPTPAAAR